MSQTVASFSAQANLETEEFERGARRMAESLSRALKDNESELAAMPAHFRRAIEEFARASATPITSSGLARIIRQFEELDSKSQFAFLKASRRVEQLALLDPNRGMSQAQADRSFQAQAAQANAQAIRDQEAATQRASAAAQADLQQRTRLSSQYWQQQFASIDREIGERQRAGAEHSQRIRRQMEEEAAAAEATERERTRLSSQYWQQQFNNIDREIGERQRAGAEFSQQIRRQMEAQMQQERIAEQLAEEERKSVLLARERAQAIREALNPKLRLVKLERELNDLRERGGLTGAEASAYLAMRQQTIQFEAGGRMASRYGMYLQQAGYQVQDFAVQVTSGTNALVALSQQGSQMLGIFGKWGAISGAVLTVGLLGYRLLFTDNAAQRAQSGVQLFRTEVERLEGSLRDLRSSHEKNLGLDEQVLLAQSRVTYELGRRTQAVHDLTRANRELATAMDTLNFGAREFASDRTTSDFAKTAATATFGLAGIIMRGVQMFGARDRQARAEAEALAAAERVRLEQERLNDLERQRTEEMMKQTAEMIKQRNSAREVMDSIRFSMLTPSQQMADVGRRLNDLRMLGLDVDNPEVARLRQEYHNLEQAQMSAADAIKASLDPLYAEELQRKKLIDLVDLGLLSLSEMEAYLAMQRGANNRQQAATQTPFNDFIRRGLQLGTAGRTQEQILADEAKKQTAYLGNIARLMEVWRN